MKILNRITTKNVQQQPSDSTDMLFEITGVDIEIDGVQYDCACDVIWDSLGDEIVESFEVFYNGDQVDVNLSETEKQYIVDLAMVHFDSDREINKSMYNDECIRDDYDR